MLDYQRVLLTEMWWARLAISSSLLSPWVPSSGRKSLRARFFNSHGNTADLDAVCSMPVLFWGLFWPIAIDILNWTPQRLIKLIPTNVDVWKGNMYNYMCIYIYIYTYHPISNYPFVPSLLHWFNPSLSDTEIGHSWFYIMMYLYP